MATNIGQLALKKVSVGFDQVIENQTVNIGQTRYFRGWNSLTTYNNVLVDGNSINGGLSELTSRNEIHLNSGFEAKKGSEVHIYNSPTFASCSPFIGYARTSGYLNFAETEKKAINEIELRFLTDPNTFDIQVYPNPNSGKFNLEITNGNLDNYTVKIVDVLGKVYFDKEINQDFYEIDACSWNNGVYLLYVIQNAGFFSKKIIIN